MARVVKEALKKTTGLTGLPVSKDPHRELKALYGKILKAVEKMPPDAAYRKYTEAIVNEKVLVVNNSQTVAELEEKMNCGQAEELITQASYELNLARKMLTWKPWEPLIQEPPPNQWKWPPVK